MISSEATSLKAKLTDKTKKEKKYIFNRTSRGLEEQSVHGF